MNSHGSIAFEKPACPTRNEFRRSEEPHRHQTHKQRQDHRLVECHRAQRIVLTLQDCLNPLPLFLSGRGQDASDGMEIDKYRSYLGKRDPL